MKKQLINKLVIIGLFFIPFFAFGQTKTYYNKQRQETTKDSAYYYRVANLNEFGVLDGSYQEFYSNDVLKLTGKYLKGKRTGDFIAYYPSGKMESKIAYQEGNEIGTSKYWHPNGKKSLEELNEGNKSYIVNMWDTTGKQIVNEGTGEYIRYDYEQNIIAEKGKLEKFKKIGTWQAWHKADKLYYTETYESGQCIKGVSYDHEGNKYEYEGDGSQQPTPQGGMQGFYKYIAQTIQYPKEARRKGIEGKVFVQFIVDKTGKLIEPKIIKGIGGGCDEEVIRLIKEAEPWLPGKQRGIPVKVRMSIPVAFKLG